ncbi:hypothetical protein QN277_005092 [Acacia crassicarpa]|uniref:Uncharacterized protein n=1 Tax=Acacia crassicarpa TaxID=499986 RepID=A0AAE1MB48_9FABA|nr:hypothetical protein QN277_005092 [Acacia crassicarpa]
MKGQEKHF